MLWKLYCTFITMKEKVKFVYYSSKYTINPLSGNKWFLCSLTESNYNKF